MVLRVPGSGTVLGALLSGLGQTVGSGSDDIAISNPTAPQLVEAIEALARAEIEFVILEQGDAFLQAAGEGDGPYQLEYKAGPDAPLLAVKGCADKETLRRVMLAYRRGESSWQTSQTWIAI
jgi:hypothetical protein